MSTYRDRQPPQNSLGCSMVVLLVLAAVCGVVWWFWWPGRNSGLDPNAQARPVEPRGDYAALEKTNIEIYQHASPSLVQITNLAVQSTLFGMDQQVPEGVGSGFVWDTDGHVVTNYHVVKGGNAARVTLSDHSTYDARQIWAYPDQDIAVIWISAPKNKLVPVMVGSSHDLKVGQVTYALGDPYGLDQTMTTGIVSALGREINSVNNRVIHGAIQTSAPINPGNSGGPLLDSAGRLIGMNTAILSPSGAFAGIGFAIPVDEINRVVPQLISHGKVVRPRLGVQLAQDQVAQQLGADQGALILKVLPSSPAAQADLQGTRRDSSGQIHLGDIIVAVNGKAINSAKDLNTALEQHKVGDTVTLTIVRDSQRQDAQVTLQAMD